MGSAEAQQEAETERVLGMLLGGSVVRRDTGLISGMRDFDLVDAADVVREAVEVTSVQLPSARAMRSAAERLRNKPLGLTSSWSLAVHESTEVKPVERDAPAKLNFLESLGVTSFDRTRPPRDPAARAAVEDLSGLRVALARILPRSSPPRLFLSGWGSGSLDSANLTRAVNTEVGKADNRSKLGAAPSEARRHLFVWLHDSHWYVSALLRDPISVPPAPTLPSEIDVVWAAVGDGPGALTCTALIRSDGRSWTDIPPP